jgi:hypothetical protein
VEVGQEQRLRPLEEEEGHGVEQQHVSAHVDDSVELGVGVWVGVCVMTYTHLCTTHTKYIHLYKHSTYYSHTLLVVLHPPVADATPPPGRWLAAAGRARPGGGS